MNLETILSDTYNIQIHKLTTIEYHNTITMNWHRTLKYAAQDLSLSQLLVWPVTLPTVHTGSCHYMLYTFIFLSYLRAYLCFVSKKDTDTTKFLFQAQVVTIHQAMNLWLLGQYRDSNI
jgi:hypothetical protein